MTTEIKKAITTILHNADDLLINEGLDLENEVITLVKSASMLAWHNSDPENEDDNRYIDIVTNAECKIINKLTMLHNQRLKDIFNIG